MQTPRCVHDQNQSQDRCKNYEMQTTLLFVFCVQRSLLTFEVVVGPISNEMGDRVRVQFPVPDIYFGM